jgi:hypothetical protein
MIRRRCHTRALGAWDEEQNLIVAYPVVTEKIRRVRADKYLSAGEALHSG